MKTKLVTLLMALLLAIGCFLLCNGLFHFLLYLFDDKPMMSGLRYLNWISLILGIAFVLIGGAGILKASPKRRTLSN